ncbi:hypothetical protein FBQ82_20605 [Anaerolineae bacterium CFX7]|nr:hypothetical protein [Anaerolineae bacterium CFX7]
MAKIVLGIVVLVLAALGACQSSAPCPPRPDDATGYLQKICLHVVNNKIKVAPANPAQYDIKKIETRTEDGRAVVWVFLDCCGMGDIAIFDKETGELKKFMTGAY